MRKKGLAVTLAYYICNDWSVSLSGIYAGLLRLHTEVRKNRAELLNAAKPKVVYQVDQFKGELRLSIPCFVLFEVYPCVQMAALHCLLLNLQYLKINLDFL